jgi:hypothetical protein
VVVYDVALDGAEGPFDVKVELLYQPVGFRWAANLRDMREFEPQRFTRYFDALSQRSAVILDQM